MLNSNSVSRSTGKMSLSVLSKRNVPVVPGFRRISGGAASNGAGTVDASPGPTRWAVDFTVNKPGFLTGISQ